MLAKTGPVTYKIQRHPQADPEIVHVDKLMPYSLILESSCLAGVKLTARCNTETRKYRIHSPSSKTGC